MFQIGRTISNNRCFLQKRRKEVVLCWQPAESGHVLTQGNLRGHAGRAKDRERCLASQRAGKLLCQLRSNDLKCEIKLRLNGAMPSRGDWPWLGGDTVAARMEEGPLEMPLASVAGITHHPARSSSTIATSGRVRTTVSNVT